MKHPIHSPITSPPPAVKKRPPLIFCGGIKVLWEDCHKSIESSSAQILLPLHTRTTTKLFRLAMPLNMRNPWALSTWLYLFFIVVVCLLTVVVCMKLMLLWLALVIISELPVVRWIVPIQLPARGRHRGIL